MANIPFEAIDELNKELSTEDVAPGIRMRRSDGRNSTLPGQPRILVDKYENLSKYIIEEHTTPELDEMAPKLWLVCN